MASEQPIEGRCGAKLSKGRGFCEQYPLSGATRCRLHNGGSQLRGKPEQRRSGSRSPYIRGITDKAQAEIDAALKDPHLLDVRRTVALSQVVVAESIPFPTDEMLDELGRRAWMDTMSVAYIEQQLKELGTDAFGEVPDVYRELARRKYMERSMFLVERPGKTQVAALRQVEIGRLMREKVIPMMVEMGLRLAKLINHYVPANKRAEFLQAFRNECRALIAEMDELQEAKAK